MRVTLADEGQGDWLHQRTAQELCFKVLLQPDAWLEAAHALLAATFRPAVLDPYERYVEWLSDSSPSAEAYPPIFVVAYFARETQALLAGVIAGSVLEIAPADEPQATVFAVGHQATAPALRSAGFRGVGTRLWQAAIDHVGRLAHERGRALDYSLAEAEADSLGFWSKLGYLWPEGVRYWQAPLLFDAKGRPLHPEVEETLLIRPVSRPQQRAISAVALRSMIEAVYRAWSLDTHTGQLGIEAAARAELYVMGEVLPRVVGSFGGRDSLALVPYPV